ncbi:methyltransferase RsmF C-terminal domain-like protein [Oribacterium sinus]
MKESCQENHISLPEEFCERMKIRLGQDWDAFLEACSLPPKRGLRLNLQKVEAHPDFPLKDWKENWKLEELIKESTREYLCDEEYLQSIGVQIGHDAYHEAGLYYIQDPSAMSVVPYMELRPFDRCLDLCASPGGKSLQIADRLKTEEGGILLSNEFIMERAKNLSKNVERMGYSHVAVSSCSAEELEAQFPAFFSRILVDAPCSGEGMFRKNPEAIADWSLEKVSQCAVLQREILDHAMGMLREGGLLAYSTCTFSEEENEGMRNRILEKHPELSFLRDKHLYFHNSVGEGQYFAIFRKQGNDLKREDVDTSKLSMLWEKKAKKYFYYPSSLKCFLSLPLLRIGVAVLEEGKKGWEWSHSLSHAIDLSKWGEALTKLPEKSPETKLLYRLSLAKEDRRVEAYLNGQEIAVEKEELQNFLIADRKVNGNSEKSDKKSDKESDKGLVLCDCDGLPLGFGYYRNGRLRNLYPKGIRFKK